MVKRVIDWAGNTRLVKWVRQKREEKAPARLEQNAEQRLVSVHRLRDQIIAEGKAAVGSAVEIEKVVKAGQAADLGIRDLLHGFRQKNQVLPSINWSAEDFNHLIGAYRADIARLPPQQILSFRRYCGYRFAGIPHRRLLTFITKHVLRDSEQILAINSFIEGAPGVPPIPERSAYHYLETVRRTGLQIGKIPTMHSVMVRRPGFPIASLTHHLLKGRNEPDEIIFAHDVGSVFMPKQERKKAPDYDPSESFLAEVGKLLPQGRRLHEEKDLVRRYASFVKQVFEKLDERLLSERNGKPGDVLRAFSSARVGNSRGPPDDYLRSNVGLFARLLRRRNHRLYAQVLERGFEINPELTVELLKTRGQNFKRDDRDFIKRIDKPKGGAADAQVKGAKKQRRVSPRKLRDSKHSDTSSSMKEIILNLLRLNGELSHDQIRNSLLTIGYDPDHLNYLNLLEELRVAGEIAQKYDGKNWYSRLRSEK